MTSGPSILLIGLSHRNMRASVQALADRGYRIRELKSLPPGSRSLSGTSLLEAAPVGSAGPTWLPPRTRTVLAAIDDDCVAVISRGSRRRGRDAAIAARLRGLPIILKTEFDVHWDPTEAGLVERVRVALIRIVESLVVRLAGVTRISPTHGEGRALRRGGLQYLPHAVVVPLDGPPALPGHPLGVITVTRCRRSKNNAGLLELASRVSEHDIRFTVVFGEDASCVKCGGRGRADLEAEVAARGLTNVAILDPVEDLTEHYRRHHVVLRNSIREGANVTVIEGAAEGCIPVVSSTSGAGQGLFDDAGGFVVAHDDIDAQHEFLVRILRDTEYRERLRTEAMAIVRERCDPERFADLVERAIARRSA